MPTGTNRDALTGIASRVNQTSIRTGQLDDDDWTRFIPAQWDCCWKKEHLH